MSKATPAQITNAIERFFEFYPGTDYVSQIDKDEYRRDNVGWSKSDFDDRPLLAQYEPFQDALDVVFAAEDAARRAFVEKHFADADNAPEIDDLRERIIEVANDREAIAGVGDDAYGEFHSNRAPWSTDDIEIIVCAVIDDHFYGDIESALEHVDGPDGEESSYWVDGGFDLNASVEAITTAITEAAKEALDDNDGEPLSYDEIKTLAAPFADGIAFDNWVEA